LDSNGNLVYATYLNGSSLALPQFSPRFLGITTDASGNAYLTGEGLFGSTPGALPLVNSYGSGFFVIKLDPPERSCSPPPPWAAQASPSMARTVAIIQRRQVPVSRCL
jgi:hypothetical protein